MGYLKDWAPYTLRTPSRAVLLAVAVGSIVLAAVVGDSVSEAGGIVGALNLAGGLACLTILLGWRWFWSGPAVVQVRLGCDPSFGPEVERRPKPGAAAVSKSTVTSCPCGCGL